MQTYGALFSPCIQFALQFCSAVAYLFTGASHGVDSSEMAFRLAAIGAMREGKPLNENSCYVIIKHVQHCKPIIAKVLPLQPIRWKAESYRDLAQVFGAGDFYRALHRLITFLPALSTDGLRIFPRLLTTSCIFCRAFHQRHVSCLEFLSAGSSRNTLCEQLRDGPNKDCEENKNVAGLMNSCHVDSTFYLLC